MYVGLDLHKATINAAVMDENGTVLKEVKIKSEPDSLFQTQYHMDRI
jgi:hypothetical protein